MTWMENIGEISTNASDGNTFVWTLPNLFNHSAGVLTPYVGSPWFSLDDNKWRLVMVPNEVCQKSRHPSSSSLPSFKFVGLYLWKLNPAKNSNEYNVKLSLESSGCVTFNGYSLSRDIVTHKNEGTGVPKFLPLSVFSEYKKHISPSGYMKIVCSMKSESLSLDEDYDDDEDDDEDDDDDDDEQNGAEDEEDDDEDENDDDSVDEEEIDAKKCFSSLNKDTKGSTKSADKNKENTESGGVDLLVQHLRELYHSGENTDAKLIVGESEFAAHRAILAARSGVFASMFEHKMTEKISGIVHIPDCPSNAFKDFLLFLYTADYDVISPRNVCDLYYVADKYEVYDLKNRCVKFMMDTLSVDMICDVMILSLRHSERKLRKSAIRFFCKNAKDIVKTVQWQKYIQEYPIQANELFIKTLDYHL